MAKIELITLHCNNPDSQRQLYREILGMMEFDDGSVGYIGDGEEARLLFKQSETSYAPTSNDLYWKISLAVPNIELAYQQLTEKGVSVGMPQQFRDIAYLAHFTDPEGFQIELIDHWFKDNRPYQTVNNDLLGGGAHLNLLTLRSSTDIKKVIQSCLDSGMKMLSVMPVEGHEFKLYFLVYTSETPPSKNEYSIENREWVFQRKYTVLEIQHLHKQTEILLTNNQKAGYMGTVVSNINSDMHIEELLMTSRN